MPQAAITSTLVFVLLSVAPGHTVFRGTLGPQHLNPLGTVDGGGFATLHDSALGCAVHTLLPAGRACTTAEARPVGPDGALEMPGREPTWR